MTPDFNVMTTKQVTKLWKKAEGMISYYKQLSFWNVLEKI